MAKGITRYSEKIAGTRTNHNLPARFDLTDGSLGITQFDNGTVSDRVLLCPKQVQELRKFLETSK